MRLEVIHGSRTLSGNEAAVFLADVSRRMHQRNRERMDRRANRISGPQERVSVQKAMMAVEDLLCKAFWVLARLPGDRNIGYSLRNGLDYMPEQKDRDYAIASGGDWKDEAPKPSTPSSREIDAMDAPLEWLRLLDREHARILAIGVRWKHGESCRKISWPRLRHKYDELAGYSTRTLQRRYHEALRTIASEVPARTIASLARQW